MTEQVRAGAGKETLRTRCGGPGVRGEESARDERRLRDKRQKCAQCCREALSRFRVQGRQVCREVKGVRPIGIWKEKCRASWEWRE